MTAPPTVQDLPLPVVGSLSPSRAGDFMTCPLLFRFRAIDRLPQTPSPAATRGTLVHAVLERLFDLPAAERTLRTAETLVAPEWERLQQADPEIAGLFQDAEELRDWLTSAQRLLEGYFTLEDPRRLEPASREQTVEVVLPGGLRLRGIVDRVDVAPAGQVRVVDYKGLALDTPLPTPSGWTTMGKVAVGEQLLGADGRPCAVTVKSDVHHRPCYEVSFTDGTTVVCDSVHLWAVWLPGPDRDEQRVVSTAELHDLVAVAATQPTGPRPYVRAALPLELPEVELPVDPWLLGAWLAAGTAPEGLRVATDDSDDLLTLLKGCWEGPVVVAPESSGAMTVRLVPVQPETLQPETAQRAAAAWGAAASGAAAWGASSGAAAWGAAATTVGGQQPAADGVSALLARAGARPGGPLPGPYLRAAREQRLGLLRGLMDVAGTWCAACQAAELPVGSAELAATVRELVASLGGECTVRPAAGSHPDGPDRVSVRLAGDNPFSLPRKALQVDGAQRQTPASGSDQPVALQRTLASVTPVASVPTQCVQVDSPDSLYLCGPTLVPTHNTGRAPGESFEGKALFQMKFYALVLWRTTGQVPTLLQLMYLGDREVLRYRPDEADLQATERKLLALWDAVERAVQRGEFAARRSKLCDWCDHQKLCPEFGGSPPPLPADAAERLAGSARATVPEQDRAEA